MPPLTSSAAWGEPRLFVKEEGVKDAFISDQPMSEEIKELNFNWENETSLSKILGFFVGEDLFADSMTNYLTVVLGGRLKKARQNPQSLMVRVKMANQLITCILWYMLTLWTGDMTQSCISRRGIWIEL